MSTNYDNSIQTQVKDFVNVFEDVVNSHKEIKNSADRSYLGINSQGKIIQTSDKIKRLL